MKRIIILLFMLCNTNVFSQTIYYVKPTGNDANSGTSWTTAFRTVQKALATIASGEIWVAAGTYYPDEGPYQTNDERNESFFLKNNVALYGGFAGYETNHGDRHPTANPTILSGEIQGDGNGENNSLHVVRTSYLNAPAVLDGFVITSGRANIHSSTSISGVGTQGAGMYNDHSSPIISNCLFIGNGADFTGGGMENYYASPTVTNCTFWRNSASYYSTWFAAWQGQGAAIHQDVGALSLINCSFTANVASNGNGYSIETHSSSMNIVNCILWDNGREIINYYDKGVSVTYSLVRGGYPGTGNLDKAPLFTDSATGNLRLQGCSPAINAGRIIAVPSSVSKDADGNPRYVPPEVDMGAYEFQPGGVPSFIFVDQTVSEGLHDGTSWANAFASLTEALQKAATCQRSEIWVTTGTYYPTTNPAERTASFLLKNNVAIRGGFQGTEVPGDPHIRRYYFTTLSGDIDGDGTLSGNAYHVVHGLDVDSSAVLDGFIITGGNADGTNEPDERGGGMYNERSYPTVTSCIITGNKARNYGGGIFNSNSDKTPVLTNCLFTNNTSDFAGGAIYNIASSPRILHCTIAGNSAGEKGGGVYNISRSYPGITNSILWANGTSIDTVLGARPQVSYSLVQGGWTGTGNLASDPLFVTNGYSLMAASPAINAGSDAAATGLVTDLEGHPRKQGLHVDMGAYEFASSGGGDGEPGEPPTITCSGNFTVSADSGRCGATVDYFDSHPALVMGGKRPVTVTYLPASPAFLSIVANSVTVTATDSTGDTKSCSFIVTVLDTTAPVISPVKVTTAILNPPNHKMHEVVVRYQASDCTPVTSALSVTSNEPVNGTGSGDTGPDWEVIDAHRVRLRAERSGNGTGRIYTIIITATDSSGNIATATTTVVVPHDNARAAARAQIIGKEDLISGLKVNAIPNPTSGRFTITTQSSSNQTFTIEVTDNVGRIVERRTGVSPNATIYLGSNYRPGLYLLKIIQGHVVQTLKLLKQG